MRPALVVQADFLNGLIDDTIFVQSTGTRHGIPGKEVELEPAVEIRSGLSKVCYASCANVLTLDQNIVVQRVGFLSDAAMRQIEKCCLSATIGEKRAHAKAQRRKEESNLIWGQALTSFVLCAFAPLRELFTACCGEP